MSVRWPAILVLVAIAIASCTSSSLDGLSGGAEPADAGAENEGGADTPPTVRCLVEHCDSESPICCALPMDGSAARRDFECRATGACAAGIVVRCRSAADCAAAGKPNDVCCLFRDSSGYMSGVECIAPTACDGLHRHLCDKQAAACASGELCRGYPGGLYALDVCAPP